MIKIDFPPHNFKTKKQGSIEKIFDQFRKKWYVLTPEEWVRQNMLIHLTKSLMYPASLFAIEKEIGLGELKKRADIVVYNYEGHPWMIIECKEMNVPLGESTINQALLYHSRLSVGYLIITNGSYTYGFEKKDDRFQNINKFPDFPKRN